ncbi:MAG: hypothetical protein ACRD30_10130 [Bryobacteraceae bacterium]
MRWWAGLVPAFFAILASAAAPEFTVEQFPVAGGSEIVTIFGRLPNAGSVPLVSVLRDTLSDQNSENDRLRYVWVLTSMRPTALQRVTGAIPFFYWRPTLGWSADRRPAPVIDMGAPSRRVVSALAGSIAQVLALDPEGKLVRSSTRSYRNNLEDQSRMHLLEGLAVVSELDQASQNRNMLSHRDLLDIETRLTLAGKTLGGLLPAGKLPAAYMKERTHVEEMRGHNWDLLRQRAEENGLYFEPFGLNGSSTHALLWIAAEDVDSNRKFDGRFLGILNPYRDNKLRNWTGYREVRDGREMIPLALYGLEYPKVPLLLVDFRDTRAPKRREMLRHAATDTVSGVLGISKFGNWPYLAGSFAFNFVRTRHGAATDRTARLKAYTEVRQWLALDPSIDDRLRVELQKRLDIMAMNPMERSILSEASIARRQYAALVLYANDPQGLPRKIEHDRQAELTAYDHGLGARFGFRLAHLVALGRYTHRDADADTLEAKLGEERRVERQTEFLEQVARSSPQTDVVWNMEDVRRAVDEIAVSPLPARTAQAVRNVLNQTSDEPTREACERALQGADAVGTR